MSGGYHDHLGDPTDSRGRRIDSSRPNTQRMISLGLDGLPEGEYYSSHSRAHGHSREYPFEDDPSETRERCTRGFVPNYYGKKSPGSISSAPDYGVDKGYRDEDLNSHPEGRMTDEYNSYKMASERSLLDDKMYRDSRRQAPKAHPKRPPAGYYGDDPNCFTTRDSHRELRDLAMQSAHSAARAQGLREDFDRDYIGHYRDNEMRRGHVKFAKGQGKVREKADKYASYHGRYCGE